MRSVIAFFVLAAAMLTVDAFSPALLATRAIPAKGKAAPKKAAVKKAAPKKVAAKKAAPKKAAPKKAVAKKTAVKKVTAKKAAPAKKKAVAKKAPAKQSAKAIALAKKKKLLAAEQRARDARLRAAAKQKPKKKIQRRATATANRVVNAGVDPALAITKNVRVKTTAGKSLFPGLDTSKAKRAPVAKKKATTAKSNGIKRTVEKEPPLNPLSFGLRVVQSEKGQEAAGILVQGGLKFVEAILDEGKKTKVVIPRGYDASTGDLKKPKVTNVGLKQLLDGGIFAGSEFFGVAKTNYEKFYVAKPKQQVRINKKAAQVDKSGKILKAGQESYYVTINGKRQLIKKNL